MNETGCAECGENNFQFTTDQKTWAEYLSCGKKHTSIKNHKFSPQIPENAKILPPEEEKLDLKKATKKALKIADDEEEDYDDEEDEYQPKPQTTERDVRRDVERYNFQDSDDGYDEYEEEELDIYEESITQMLIDLLKGYGIKQNVLKNIKRQSERLEEQDEYISPRDLEKRLIALTKMKKEAVNLLVSDYAQNLELVEEEEPRSSFNRDFDRRPTRRREKPQSDDVTVLLQELNNERMLNDLKRESDKDKFRISRLEEKNGDLNRENMQLRNDIRNLEQINSQIQLSSKDTDVKIKDIELTHEQQKSKAIKLYKDDEMQFTADVIGKVVDLVDKKEPLKGFLKLGEQKSTSKLAESKVVQEARQSRNIEENPPINVEDLIVDEDEY